MINFTHTVGRWLDYCHTRILVAQSRHLNNPTFRGFVSLRIRQYENVYNTTWKGPRP